MACIKILYIVDSYTNPYAGTESQLYKLITHLDRNKFEPHLLVFNSSSYISENGFPCGTSTLGRSSLSSLTTWYALFQCLREKKREGFRLAHIFFNDPSIIAPPLLKVLGFKTLISRRDMGYWYTRAYLAILRLNARIIDGAIVNSRAVKEITCEQERLKEDAVHVIYNGYDALEVSEFASLANQEIEKLQGPFLDVDDQAGTKPARIFTLGLVANIRPIKRIQDAIIATAMLASKGYALRLVVVGGGPRDALSALAADKNVCDRVFFVGAQSDTSSYIQNFDLCLLCSESEGFSNAIIEYMQHGKPVVCSKVGGNPEIIDDGKVGYLYPAGDIDALASKIELFLVNEAKVGDMGKQAQIKVRSSYSMEKMVEQTNSVYYELLSQQ